MTDKKSYLGEFEQIVLLALVRLRNNAYGMTIRRRSRSAPAESSRLAPCTQRLKGSRKRAWSPRGRVKPPLNVVGEPSVTSKLKPRGCGH